MVSSQIRHFVADFDEIIGEKDDDFSLSGLKTTSVIRVGRLAVVNGEIFLGSIGQIKPARLLGIKSRLANWLST